MTRTLCALVALFLVSRAFSQTSDVPSYFQDAATTIGHKGTLNADGSYRINIARTDVKFTSSGGMPIPADLGLSTYIAFSGSADHALAVGDVAMLEGEIDGVIDKLRAGRFEIVALHNHMTTEEPRLFYLHFQITGTVADIANGFKSVVAVLGHGVAKTAETSKGKPKIDPVALETVLGVKSQVFPSGVLRYANPRKDIKVTVENESFLPGMGLGSWVAFYPCDCGDTMAMGDTCCTRGDLQAVIDSLRKASIHISAIHNHVLGASQEVVFLHYDSEGDVLPMAVGIRAAWDVLGSGK